MSAQPPVKKTAGLIEKETDERRTLNVQHRIMYSVNLIKDSVSLLGRSGYEARQRINNSNFDSAMLDAVCGSLVIKSIKRSLRLVGVVAPTPRRASSIFDVRCWAFDVRRSRLLIRLEDSLFQIGGISYEVSYKRGLRLKKQPV